MDILAPYNVERLLLLSSAYNYNFVKEIMGQYEEDSKAGVDIPEDIHNSLKGIVVGKQRYFLQIRSTSMFNESI